MTLENIITARTALIMNDTVYGVAGAFLKIIESKNHESFKVDGKYLYVDMDGLLTCNAIAAKIKEGVVEYLRNGIGTENYAKFKQIFLLAHKKENNLLSK